MTWAKGREAIAQLVAERKLQRVPASSAASEALLAQARRHLASAEMVAATDPAGGYALVYDAARKAMAAVYEAQGLRATSTGGHVVLHDAAEA